MIEFLRQAAVDPKVVAIRMTLYRTGISSVMVDLLEEAARRGKEVTAIVELKARFDEEANINLAERLEAVGAQVVYGVVGLKTHGKMTLVLRREEVRGRPAPRARMRISGTGNYHPTTTKLYTDFGMLTAHPEICGDIEKAFHASDQSDEGREAEAPVAGAVHAAQELAARLPAKSKCAARRQALRA